MTVLITVELSQPGSGQQIGEIIQDALSLAGYDTLFGRRYVGSFGNGSKDDVTIMVEDPLTAQK